MKGVSLIELILVVGAVAFLGLLINNLPSTVSSISGSRNASLAREIAGRKINDLRGQTYINLSDGSESFLDPSMASLPSSSGTFIIEDCPQTICKASEQAKLATVQVVWKESGNNKTVQLVTLVSERGLSQ